MKRIKNHADRRPRHRYAPVEGLESRTLLAAHTISIDTITRAIGSETDANTVGRAWMQITREGPTDQALNVFYAVNPSSTATAGADYATLPGWVTIPAGKASVNVPLVPIDDNIAEPTETVSVSLTGGNYVINPAKKTVNLSITDNDGSSVPTQAATVSVKPITRAVGSETNATSVGRAWMQFTREGPITSALNVYYNVLPVSSATSGQDYQPLTGWVTIPAGRASVSVPLIPIDDDIVEGSETVFVALGAGKYNIDSTNNLARLYIADNDSAPVLPVVSISSSDAQGSEAGDPFSFTVTRTGSTADALEVHLAYTGAATSADVTNGLPAIVTIPAGQASITVIRTPADDALVEGQETFTATIATSSNYTRGDTFNQTITIIDNDSTPTLPTVSISSSDAQGGEGGNSFSFTLTRTGATTNALVVSLTYGGTADSADVTSGLPATVTIPAGQSSVTVTRIPVDDAADEGTETLTVTIATSASYERGSTYTQNITILDNDAAQPTMRPDWWNEDWNYRTAVTFNSGSYAREDKTFVTNVNFTNEFSDAGASGSLILNSLRVVETNAAGTQVLDANVPFQFDQASNYNAASNATGQLVILASGTTDSNTTRYYHVYFDKSGSFNAASVSNRVTTTDNISDEGQTSVRIATANATYYYQKENGGFSSIVDANGNDWLNFHNTSGSGSAGEYRGIPNAVFPGGGYHAGFTTGTTTIVSTGPLRTVLKTDSVIDRGQGPQNWSMTWEFYSDHATCYVTQAPGSYWFLYEGTPGGSIDGSDFVVRSDGTNTALSQSWTDNDGLGSGNGASWVYFGDAGLNRHLFMAEHTADNIVDSYYLMEGNMTVFGFGRDGGNSYLTGNRAFTIGINNNNNFNDAAAGINNAYRDVTANVGTGQYKLV